MTCARTTDDERHDLRRAAALMRVVEAIAELQIP